MGERTFIPFQENGYENGGSDYGSRILRSGKDTFGEKHGCTRAFIIRYNNRQPCPRCGKPLLQGQYGRFHRDYGDELVHDGCCDHSDDEPKSYVCHGKRKLPRCSLCNMEHVGAEDADQCP